MEFNFLKKKTKEVNCIEDIDFTSIESEDIQWLLETLHNMPTEHSNDYTLGGSVRAFFRQIDEHVKQQEENE